MLTDSRLVWKGLAVVVLLALAAPSGAASAENWGKIHCILAVPFWQTPCDAGMEGADDMQLTVGDVSSVTLTVSWSPLTPSARELALVLEGNPDCAESQHPNCFLPVAEGESPLSVTLRGDAASNFTAKGWVDLTSPCRTRGLLAFPTVPPQTDRVECDTIPVKLVMDQPFTYHWTVG